MTRLSTSILIVIACMFASPVFAVCTYPQEATVPDGARATEAEMLAAKQRVKNYIAGVEDYLMCLESEAAAEPGPAPGVEPDRQADRTAALESMRNVTDSYNAQVLAFKAVNE